MTPEEILLLAQALVEALRLLGVFPPADGLVPAQESYPRAIEQYVSSNFDTLGVLWDKLDELHDDLQSDYDLLYIQHGAILDAIDALPAPPAEAPPPGDIADAVWDWASSRDSINADVHGITMQQLIEDSWSVLNFQAGHIGVQNPLAPYFNIVVYQPWKLGDTQFNWPNFNTDFCPEAPDFTEVIPGDTPYTFLARTQPTYEWTNLGPTGLGVDEVAWKAVGGVYPDELWVRSNFTSLEMHQLAYIVNPPAPVVPPAGPPVWPGADAVTLGTPAAIAAGLTITEPMDGVKVHITAVDPKQMWFTYDDERAYRHIGALAFVDDSGNLETWQTLGFTHAVYCPKTMRRAAAVKVMTPNGTVGTVTPWVVTS